MANVNDRREWAQDDGPAWTARHGTTGLRGDRRRRRARPHWWSALDVDDPAFIDDPYPALGALREATPIVFDRRRGVWLVTRFDDIHAAFRDRRLGRQFRHRYTDGEFGQPPLDARWGAFHQHERWSLLALEPPDHTRIRRSVAKVFTPRAVAELQPAIPRPQRLLLDPLAACATGSI